VCNLNSFVDKTWLAQVTHTKSRSKRHGGASTGPRNQTFGKNHHCYAHGFRTKEVVAMRKRLAAMLLEYQSKLF
jgi:hypothetical protein